ncbi:hypothetical protein GCM10027569_57160 [Flindersiella endophytica]
MAGGVELLANLLVQDGSQPVSAQMLAKALAQLTGLSDIYQFTFAVDHNVYTWSSRS